MPVLRAKATKLQSINARIRTSDILHASIPRLEAETKNKAGRPSARRRSGIFNASIHDCLDAQARKSPEGTLSAKGYVPRRRSPRMEVREFQLIHSLHGGKDFKRAQKALCQELRAKARKLQSINARARRSEIFNASTHCIEANK